MKSFRIKWLNIPLEGMVLLIWSSIGCALSLKFCREAWAHVFQRTQKAFWEIPPKNNFIKIINIFNGPLSLNLGN